MKRSLLAVAAIVWSVPAFAQPTPPECKDFPNGGKVSVDVPVVRIEPTCQACGAGFSVPSGFVLRFSNGHHDTCELKKPDGSNSGYCKADTTCPPGTTRTYLDNTLWVCQSGGGKKAIDCPVPKLPDPKPITTPPAVQSCIAQMKATGGTLTTSANGFVTAVANGQPGLPSGSGVQAAAMMGVMIVHFTGEKLPLALRKKATCDNIDRTNATAVADCDRATSDYRTSKERGSGLSYKFKDARTRTKREIVEARKNTKAGVAAAADALDTAVDAADKAFDTCVAGLTQIVP